MLASCPILIQTECVLQEDFFLLGGLSRFLIFEL